MSVVPFEIRFETDTLQEATFGHAFAEATNCTSIRNLTCLQSLDAATAIRIGEKVNKHCEFLKLHDILFCVPTDYYCSVIFVHSVQAASIINVAALLDCDTVGFVMNR